MRTGISSSPSTTLLKFVIDVPLRDYHFDIKVGDCYRPCDRLNGHYASSAGSTFGAIKILYDQLTADNKIKEIAKIDRSTLVLKPTGFIPSFSALDIKHMDMDNPYTEEMIDYSPFDLIYISSGNSAHDGYGINDALYENRVNIIRNIKKFHKDFPVTPSRDSKVSPLDSITLGFSEWSGAGKNILNWKAVEGATHYEIFSSEQSRSPLKTTTSTSARINISHTGVILVRACDEMTCSYPKSIRVIHRNHRYDLR
jgi:hypothetical protein